MLAFGAVAVTTGVIGDPQQTTAVAALDMATQVSGTTVQEVGYDLALLRP
jgi:hypothetical protein